MKHTEKLKKKGMTIAGWSRVNGFPYNYVRQVLGGKTKKYYGRQCEILKQAVKDGLISKKEARPK